MCLGLVQFWNMTDPSSVVDVSSPTPTFQSYILTAACTLNSWKAAAPAEIAAHDPGPFRKDLEEDSTGLVAPELASVVLPDSKGKNGRDAETAAIAARRKHFAVEAKRKAVVIDPDMVFAVVVRRTESLLLYFTRTTFEKKTEAFENYNPHFDPNTFRLRVPGAMSVDITRFLDGQPFRLALRTKDRSATFVVVELRLEDGEVGGALE
ncbi:hypothetical protein HK104_006273 [Borealophlyctis nickersoniae]|nr:hypothetical protein HK104_006273 [Borealophlyctis nickersoniae]